MYVRWKRRGDWFNKKWGYSLACVLAECRRINGKPRQKYIMQLGYIRGNCLENEYRRIRFWRQVELKLEYLKSIYPELKTKKIKDDIARRVPRLTPKERAIDRKENNYRGYYLEGMSWKKRRLIRDYFDSREGHGEGTT